MVRALLAIVLLVMLPGVAHAQWHEASSPHFVIYAKQKPEQLRAFAETLERFDQAMRSLRGWRNDPIAPATRVTIYVLGSADAVSELAGSGTVAGFYSGRASGSVAFVPRNERTREFELSGQAVLFHEYAHHLMLSIFANGAFPSWLVEGWAEFHATAQIKRDGAVTFGYAPSYRAWGLLAGNPLPLERILGGDLAKLSGEQIDALYGRGWLLTHYFTFEPVRTAQFGKYIQAINAGKPARDAMAEFGDLRVLQRELDRYLKQPRLSARTVFPAAITIGDIAIRPLTAGEAAMMPVRLQSDRGVDGKSAPRVYAAAKKAAAPYPNDPRVQGMLAETAYDAKDYAGALAATERALAADPRSMQALTYKAMTLMAQAEERKDHSAATWSAIRKVAVSANRIDPDNPEILILYYRGFADAGTRPPEVAKDGLYRAFELVPQDRSLRFYVAQMFLDDGDFRHARALLAPLAYDPHSGPMAVTATKLIEEIDSGDTKAAGQELRKETGAPPPEAPAPAAK